VHGSTGKQMQVDVVDGLPAVTIAVHHHPLAVFIDSEAAGDLFRGQEHLTDQGSG